MAISITVTHDIPIGQTEHLVFGTFDFDSSYPTGGESFDITNVRSLEWLDAQSKGGYVFEWDAANQKVKAINTTAAHTHTENTAGSYTQNATTGSATATKGTEVANTTDLSAITGVSFVALTSS